jgi:hypothetical protein
MGGRIATRPTATLTQRDRTEATATGSYSSHCSPFAAFTPVTDAAGAGPGFWSFADCALEWIGKTVIWIVTGGKSLTENAAYAIIGAAMLSGAFGGAIGFAFSHASPSVNTDFGTILGILLGICLGILFGSFVEIVNWWIEDLLRSLGSDSLDQEIKSGGAAKHA